MSDPVPYTADMAFDVGRQAWHFVAARGGRPVFYHGAVAEVGVRLKCRGALVLCRHGYHASWDPLSALNYAPGPFACRVLVGGDTVESIPEGQLVARWREVVTIKDATDDLVEFARLCADEALALPGVNRAQLRAINSAQYHARYAADDPVSAAVQAALSARIASGCGADDPWPPRNAAWVRQNAWLVGRLLR